MTSIAELEARVRDSRQRAVALAAQAERDYQRDLASLERARLAERQRLAIQQKRDPALTRPEYRSFEERVQSVMRRLGAGHPAIPSYLHLIDLVRAGHVRGTGELNIPSDGNVSRGYGARNTYPLSLTGSSAAFATEA